MLLSTGNVQNNVNWLFQLFTDNGFMMVTAVVGFIALPAFVFGLHKEWWYMGNYVRRQQTQIDAYNAYMEASAAAKADESTTMIKRIDERTEKQFEAIERREEALANDLRDIRIQGGGNRA